MHLLVQRCRHNEHTRNRFGFWGISGLLYGTFWDWPADSVRSDSAVFTRYFAPILAVLFSYWRGSNPLSPTIFFGNPFPLFASFQYSCCSGRVWSAKCWECQSVRYVREGCVSQETRIGRVAHILQTRNRLLVSLWRRRCKSSASRMRATTALNQKFHRLTTRRPLIPVRDFDHLFEYE